MKKILFMAAILLFSVVLSAQNLYLINFKSLNDRAAWFEHPNFEVHYYNDDFLIGSGTIQLGENQHLIDKDFKNLNSDYYLVWLPRQQADRYLNEISEPLEFLYLADNFLIAKTEAGNAAKIKSAVHGGVVAVRRDAARLPKRSGKDFVIPAEADPFIQELTTLVIQDSIQARVQHLQDYGTRYYNSSQAEEAEAWIAAEFENYGLSVELTSTGQGGSDNVIALQTGFAYPETYVVVGGHYDSTSYGSTAPGADDNASGTSGVMEIARILSNYDFEYSIIYCAWSAEEIGLLGSGAWASAAAANDMDIMAYLNLDMISYLHPGNDFFTSMIAPSSAQPLVDFYIGMVDLYVNDFAVYDATFIGGDSDHTSFNNNGYMGIFPFEDSQNYSPHIHTEEDLIGPSFSSAAYAEKFVQTGVAVTATLAKPFSGLYPPMSLSYEQADNQVVLNWQQPLEPGDNFAEYRLYKNSELLTTITDIEQTDYTDPELLTGGLYEYYITAFYEGDEGGESSASNTVSFVLGLEQQYFWDFEGGAQDWTIAGDETGWIWGLDVGLGGNSTDYLGIDSDAAGSGTHVADYAISPELDLSNFDPLYLEFDYGFRDWGSDFLKVVYRRSPSEEWTEIANLSSSNAFIHQSLLLPQEAAANQTQIAFWYDDNNTWAWYAGVDNVEIVAVDQAVGVCNSISNESEVSISPNPATEYCRLSFSLEKADNVSVRILDISGKELYMQAAGNYSKGSHRLQLPVSGLENGLYIIVLEAGNANYVEKLLINR